MRETPVSVSVMTTVALGLRRSGGVGHGAVDVADCGGLGVRGKRHARREERCGDSENDNGLCIERGFFI